MKLSLGFAWLIFVVHLLECNSLKRAFVINNPKILIVIMQQENEPVFPKTYNYTSYEEIIVRSAKLNALTTEMQTAISNVTTLRIQSGWMESINLMDQQSIVQIHNCSTSLVIINPNLNYQTADLAIVYNRLEKLPKHLNVLTNLEKLFLHDNRIEFVAMAEFNGLNKLKFLALQRNKITEIRATLQNPVILPKLEKIFIDNNHLTDISFEHWNTSNLNLINLQENQLQIALSLPGKLNGLKGVALPTNPLNCEWLNSTLKQLKDRNVTVYDETFTKCNATGPELKEIVRRVNFKETFATLPLLRHSQFELKEFLRSKLKNLEANIEIRQQQNESLQTNFDKIDIRISELSSKSEKLQTEMQNNLLQTTNATSTTDQKLKEMESFFKLQMESLRKSVLNITEATDLHLLKSNQSPDQELVEMREHFERKISKLETDGKNFQAEIRHVLELLNELQRQHNVSPISTTDSVHGGSLKLDKYVVIFVVLAILFCLYLVKTNFGSITCAKSDQRKKNSVGEMPLTSIADDTQQYLERQQFDEK